MPVPWKALSQIELATAEWVDWCHSRRLYGEIAHVPPVKYEAYTKSTKHQVPATEPRAVRDQAVVTRRAPGNFLLPGALSVGVSCRA